MLRIKLRCRRDVPAPASEQLDRYKPPGDRGTADCAVYKEKIGGDTANKPCGIGSVGFPRPLLPVAIGAVSLQNERRAVSARATELPLSPHCNLCHILIDSLGAFLGSIGYLLASFAVVVSHSDRSGFREPLVTARCSMIRHNHSRQATLQAACVPPCRFS